MMRFQSPLVYNVVQNSDSTGISKHKRARDMLGKSKIDFINRKNNIRRRLVQVCENN